MSDFTDFPAESLELPMLPLRDVVVFPHMVIPLFVGRTKSIHALEAAMEADKVIMLWRKSLLHKRSPQRPTCMTRAALHPYCNYSSYLTIR